MRKDAKEVLRRRFLEIQVPDKRRVMVERAFAATASPRMAIKAHCFVCSGMDAAEAKNCSVLLCALYEYNPYRKSSSSLEEEPSSASEPEDEQEAADAR